jgi:hypothetical protein
MEAYIRYFMSISFFPQGTTNHNNCCVFLNISSSPLRLLCLYSFASRTGGSTQMRNQRNHSPRNRTTY